MTRVGPDASAFHMVRRAQMTRQAGRRNWTSVAPGHAQLQLEPLRERYPRDILQPRSLLVCWQALVAVRSKTQLQLAAVAVSICRIYLQAQQDHVAQRLETARNSYGECSNELLGYGPLHRHSEQMGIS